MATNKSKKQLRLFKAASRNKEIARKIGISQQLARTLVRASIEQPKVNTKEVG